MAVAQVHQREIVEVPFMLPDGQWLSRPLAKKSYFVTHIVSMFNTDDVIAHHNCFLRTPYFDNVVERVVANIIDGDWEELQY